MTRFFVLQVVGDVEPVLHGPFTTESRRDEFARNLRKEDRQDLKNGLYKAQIIYGKLSVDSYRGDFFQE
jgi:hypothetical protein